MNLPVHAQRLLLDFTQFGTYRPLGYEKATPKRADVRLIGATNGDVALAIREGRLREDLFHRLAGVVLTLPPLRARRQEIPTIAQGLLRSLAPTRPLQLSPALCQLLASHTYDWPGNIRELERIMVRARHRALRRNPEAAELTADDVEWSDLALSIPQTSPAARAAPRVPDADPGTAWQRLGERRALLRAEEKGVILGALTRAEGVIATAARLLRIPRTTLASRMVALGIASSRCVASSDQAMSRLASKR